MEFVERCLWMKLYYLNEIVPYAAEDGTISDVMGIISVDFEARLNLNVRLGKSIGLCIDSVKHGRLIFGDCCDNVYVRVCNWFR